MKSIAITSNLTLLAFCDTDDNVYPEPIDLALSQGAFTARLSLSLAQAEALAHAILAQCEKPGPNADQTVILFPDRIGETEMEAEPCEFCAEGDMYDCPLHGAKS